MTAKQVERKVQEEQLPAHKILAEASNFIRLHGASDLANSVMEIAAALEVIAIVRDKEE